MKQWKMAEYNAENASGFIQSWDNAQAVVERALEGDSTIAVAEAIQGEE